MCSGIKFSKYYNLKLQLKNPENAIVMIVVFCNRPSFYITQQPSFYTTQQPSFYITQQPTATQIVSGVLECVKQSSLVQYVQDNHQIAVITWKSNNIKDQGISMAFKGLNFSYSTSNW